MKLYVGSRDYKPDGYLTVDIDPANAPDIVADIITLSPIQDVSCDEIVAGHVLEHIEWPDGFRAISQFARVLKIGGTLKIAVPDLSLLTRMVAAGTTPFHAVGLIFGVGGRHNAFEAHRYGYTADMMVDILRLLGFGDFRWWNSDLADASNGWCPQPSNEQYAISLNIAATKTSGPVVDPHALFSALEARPLDDITTVAASLARDAIPQLDRSDLAKLYQSIHFQLIEQRQRTRYLEEQIESALAHPGRIVGR
ncbi:class I SAM-dependent methyltransferase [Alsobacter sp. R-9]